MHPRRPVWYNPGVQRAATSHDPMIAWATAVVAVWLCGSVLPFANGILVPMLGLVATAACGVWLARTLRRPLRQVPLLGRRALVGLWIIFGGLVATLTTRMIGALVVAFPAVVWTLLGILCVAAIAARARAPGLRWLAVPTLVLACVVGTRFEAGAVDARGAAQSGPILGIHPFQSTSIAIDGFGPIDIPFNDFVEADGSRGYSPQAAGEALERALHKMAEVHFADGPARARQAFAGARVEVVETTPVFERLDKQPDEDVHRRFIVHSGTIGQRSRMAFACPGRRLDPRGMQPDRVTEQMCPDKYTSEASAGLGVTGRWTGYVEFRGNERLGLGPLLGWTRSDEPLGRRHTLREAWGWAWIALVFALIVSLRRAAVPVLGATGRIAASTLIFVVVAGLASVATGTVALQLLGEPNLPTGLSYLPLVGLLGFFALRAPTDTDMPRARGGVWVATVWIVGLTLWVSQHLAATDWIVPELWYHRGPGIGHADWALAGEAWVLEVADRFPELQAIAQSWLGSEESNAGIGLAFTQNLVASTFVALLFGTLVGTIRSVGLWCRRLRPLPSASAVVVGRIGAVCVCAIAAGLVMSRQTAGASLLLPYAMYAGALCAVVVASYRLTKISGLLVRGVGGAALTGMALHQLWQVAHTSAHPGLFLHTLLVICALGVANVWILNLLPGRVSSAPATDKQDIDT